MAKQGNSSMEAPAPMFQQRYPMMRGPMGGQQHANNANSQMQSSGGHFGSGNRPMGPRPANMGHPPPIVGAKRDSSGFGVMGTGGGGGPTFHGSPGQGGASQDSSDGGNFAKLFVGSVPRTVTEDDIRPLFAEHGNVLEVALIKDKRTGQQQVMQDVSPWGLLPAFKVYQKCSERVCNQWAGSNLFPIA